MPFAGGSIAWLRFFLGWAEAAQVSVRLSGVSEALAARLMEAERAAAGSARPTRREAAGNSTASDLKLSPLKEEGEKRSIGSATHSLRGSLSPRGRGEQHSLRSETLSL